jgi:FMN-dependent NADH-azoreductase
MTILHIDSSAQLEGSTTRALSAEIVAKLRGEMIRRDLAEALPLINHT